MWNISLHWPGRGTLHTPTYSVPSIFYFLYSSDVLCNSWISAQPKDKLCWFFLHSKHKLFCNRELYILWTVSQHKLLARYNSIYYRNLSRQNRETSWTKHCSRSFTKITCVKKQETWKSQCNFMIVKTLAIWWNLAVKFHM